MDLVSKNISEERLNSILEKLDDKARFHLQTIVDNTIYIKTDEMIEMVRDAFRRCVAEHPKYNIYVPSDKIGSDHYIMMALRDELNPVQVMYKNDTVTNDHPILMIDDAVYSSCHMCAHIDDLQYGKKCCNEFCVVVAVLSQREVQVVTDFGAQIYSYMTLEHLLPQRLFSDYDYRYLHRVFGCETTMVLPVFFEHKIANVFGSYEIYKELALNPISRLKIDKIQWSDVEVFVRSFNS